MDGRVVLVTGAASGIGRAVARSLASAGARLALLDIAAAGLDEALPEDPGVLHLVTDVTDAAEVGRAVAATVERFGRLDGAVNSAGVLGPAAPAATLPLDAVRRVLDVNVVGLFACMQAEIRAMIGAGGGSIVNVASAAGLVGVSGLAGYAASKHAVVGLTRSAALDHARDGVRINAVCPGIVATPMMGEIASGSPAAAIVAANPIARAATAEEVAAAIIWLLSDAAAFITGAALPVDGGYTAR